MKSKELAALVAVNYAELTGNKEAALDPATISGYISLILGIFQQFKDCKKSPAAALKDAQNPGLFQRVSLRRIVKDDLGAADFRLNGKEVMQALLNSAKNLTEKDVTELYKEV